MRALTLCALLTLAGADASLGQVDGHGILFPADSTTIAEADQRAIFDQLGYTVGADGSSLEVVDCGTIFAWADEEDLNGDGVPEVFVIGGNSCTSGMAGSNLSLFIRDTEGGWGMNLGFSAGGWTKLETGNQGWPDLSIGGPGFCEAVYRWDGSTYQYHGERETEPGGCEEIG
ncbi:MAG TPA: hypothetical protein VFQ21_10885 [Gemmatimonadota bacterium]|nr:hypothetical protein [Gemmatimonadota bacterium]